MKTFQLIPSFRRGIVVTLLLVVAAFHVGCVAAVAGAAAGAGTVLYVRGELQAGIDRRFEVVERASNRALKELQFMQIEEKKDALVAILTARTAEDTKIRIKVERSGDALSTVRIRVGTFGNEKLARLILEKINEGL